MPADQKQAIKEIALLAVVIFLLTVMGLVLPFLSFFWPVPVIILFLRRGAVEATLITFLIAFRPL